MFFRTLAWNILLITSISAIPSVLVPRHDGRTDDIPATWHAFGNVNGGASCHPDAAGNPDIQGAYKGKYDHWDGETQPLVAWGAPGGGHPGWREAKNRATYCYHKVRVKGKTNVWIDAVLTDTKDEGGLDMSTCLWRAVMGTEKGAGGGQASIRLGPGSEFPVKEFCDAKFMPGWMQFQASDPVCKSAVEGWDGSGGTCSAGSASSTPKVSSGSVSADNNTSTNNVATTSTTSTNGEYLPNIVSQNCPWDSTKSRCDCKRWDNVEAHDCATCTWDVCCQNNQQRSADGTCAASASAGNAQAQAQPSTAAMGTNTNTNPNDPNTQTQTQIQTQNQTEGGGDIDPRPITNPLHNFIDKYCPWNPATWACDCYKRTGPTAEGCKSCKWDACCSNNPPEQRRGPDETCQVRQQGVGKRGWAGAFLL